MVDCKPTQLEQLPDELFLQIFSQFDAIELYRSWSLLNHRITSILTDVPLSIDTCCWEYIDQHLHLCHLLAPKLVRFCTLVSSPNIDLEQLPKLCSLTICSPSTAAIATIIRLPNLQFLSCTEDQSVIDALFSGSANRYFPSLRTCNFIDSCSILRHHFQPNHTLRSLSLFRCPLTQCEQLFTLLPRLQHFKVDNFRDMYIEVSLMRPSHQLLTHLQLGIQNTIAWSDLSILLQLTPQIRRLHLYGTHSSFDLAMIGQEILAKRTPHLKRFECNLRIVPIADEQIDLQQTSTFLKSIQCHINIT